MKYLIINELYEKGGTEVQSLREKKNFELHGDEVLYMTFDPKCGQEKSDGHINISMNHNVLKKVIYRMFEDKKMTKKIRRVIETFKPDLIHLNNTTDHALSIFKAINGYPTFQTIRDYMAVCPTGLCVDKNWHICNGRKCGQCLSKCVPDDNKMVFFYYYFVEKRRFKLRKKYIKQFVCPSEILTEYCNAHGMNTVCINNPFNFSVLNEFNSIQYLENVQKKIFLFYGVVTEYKGIFRLLDVFDDFSCDKEVELWIVGECQYGIIECLKTFCKNKKIKYLGKHSYFETLKILNQVYAVIVPSLWMENYPNTVLESLSFGKIVLASNRGGMREMIRDERFIFDVMDYEDMFAKLNYAYFLSNDEYLKIAKKNKQYIQENNTLNMYYDQIINLYEKLKVKL